MKLIAFALAATSASVSALPAPSAPPSSLPSGHPSIPADEQLPPGHPSAMPDDEPEAQFPKIPRDDSRADPSLPTGAILATIRDELDRPVPNTTVTLGIVRTSVSEGESRTRPTAVTAPQGNVRFDSLKTGTGWAYRISITANSPSDPDAFASYSAEPFQLPLEGGWFVLLHRFPVASSIDKLLAAVEGVDMIVEVRDDVLDVSMMFDVINAGTTTWSLGKGLDLALPKGFKAVRAAEAMDDHTAVATESGVRWSGSFPPGRSRIAYDFKLPYEGEPSVDFDVMMPPRVLAARVRTAARRGMELTVGGFPPAQSETSATGVKVLSTVKQGSPQDPIRTIRVLIKGLPTPGSERWLFVTAALAAAGVGVYFSRISPAQVDRKATVAARKKKRKVLLAELVELERAHRAGDVGPKAYARERAKLVDAIADTLDPDAPARALATSE
jgi:hypothetical protein